MKNKILIHYFILLIFLFYNNSSPQWVQTSCPSGGVSWGINCLTSKGDTILAGCLFRVYRSTNAGLNWTGYNFGSIAWLYLNDILIKGDTVFAGTGNGIFMSTNWGVSWMQRNTGLTNTDVRSITLYDNNLFAGTYNGGGVYISTNWGEQWSAVNNGLQNLNVKSIAAGNNCIYAGTIDDVFITTNNGAMWLFRPVNSVYWADINYIYAKNQDAYVATYARGLYYTNNQGLLWSQIFPGGRIYTTFQYSNIILMTTTSYDDGGIYLTSNSGLNWSNISEGTPSGIHITEFTVSGDYIYASATGYGGGGVYKRLLSQIISINHISNKIPSGYSLLQNYPNPFNPKTNIKFDLPKTSYAKLIVYDALGREVVTLVNEKLAPGTYEVDWNGSGYTSGVYFYRLEAGEYVEVKKMVLIK